MGYPTYRFAKYLFCIPSLESWQNKLEGFDGLAALLKHVSKGESTIARVAFSAEVRYGMLFAEGYWTFDHGTVSRAESLTNYLNSIRPFGIRRQNFIFPEILVKKPVPYSKLTLEDTISVPN